MSETRQPQDDVRPLTQDKIEAVGGAGIFSNTGCIVISASQPMPTYNPWLDPYSPERRFG